MVGVKTNILEAEDVFDSTQEAWDPQVLLQSECETTTGNWIFKESQKIREKKNHKNPAVSSKH